MTTRALRTAAIGAAAALAFALPLATASTAGAATGPSGQDRAFLVTAHQSNLSEIAAGKLAAAKGAPADIQAEGRLWIRQHSALDASGAKLAGTYDLTLPATPNAMQQQAAVGLRARSGTAFDTDWISVGLAGHAKTLAAVKKEIADGSNPDFVAAARTAEPIVAHHLRDLKALAVTYGVALPASVPAGTGGQAAGQASTGRQDVGLPLAGLGAVVAAGGGWVLLRRRRGAATV